MTDALNLKSYIRDIPDFPKPGIMFRDITPLLAHAGAFRSAIEQLAAKYRAARVDVIVAAEARGFIFAAPLAVSLGAGFVPIRKPGKLPFDTHAFRYDLEYGSDIRPASSVRSNGPDITTPASNAKCSLTCATTKRLTSKLK